MTSGQEVDIGRQDSPPHTTIRITTNLKTKCNQECQKIELNGSPTTKNLKKKYSSRWVGGAEPGTRAERVWCGVVRQQHQWLAERLVPHSCAADKNQKGHLGSEQSHPQARPHSPGIQYQENKAL